ncbi:hypothetical protein [Streptomyces sp. YIM 121038]|uniref:hypothetical protein n=1 Tax=Streptomyces sp. YIM 121038 TaxID=2136401 RepID=UPI001110F460|nr:hypothetical protein [Streptomyces sp. YIM 121038]
MSKLPTSDHELLVYLLADETQAQIGSRFGASQQAVAERLKNMRIHTNGPNSDSNRALPWPIDGHPQRSRFVSRAPFRGLRAFLLLQGGQKVTDNAMVYFRAFVGHIESGEVLAFDDERGFYYTPRTTEDGDLVIRWPDGARPLRELDKLTFDRHRLAQLGERFL